MPQSPNDIISNAFIECLDRETMLVLTESDKNVVRGYLSSLPAKKVWGLLHDIPSDMPVSAMLNSNPLLLTTVFAHSPYTDHYMSILDTVRVKLGMTSWFERDSAMLRSCREELMLEECEETFTMRDIVLLRAFVDVLMDEFDDEEEEEEEEEQISQGTAEITADISSDTSIDTDTTEVIPTTGPFMLSRMGFSAFPTLEMPGTPIELGVA